MDACGLSDDPAPHRGRSRCSRQRQSRALALASASSARIMALPNPCTILASSHPQILTAKAGAAASPGKLKEHGSGKYERATWGGTVGTISVYLFLYKNVGGSGGVRITSQTHPAGFGGTATLTVGMGAGNNARSTTSPSARGRSTRTFPPTAPSLRSSRPSGRRSTSSPPEADATLGAAAGIPNTSSMDTFKLFGGDTISDESDPPGYRAQSAQLAPRFGALASR